MQTQKENPSTMVSFAARDLARRKSASSQTAIATTIQSQK